ncbi:MAG: hypothetical protein ACJA1Z_000527, partial [Patiriisocius sp.]
VNKYGIVQVLGFKGRKYTKVVFVFPSCLPKFRDKLTVVKI